MNHCPLGVERVNLEWARFSSLSKPKLYIPAVFSHKMKNVYRKYSIFKKNGETSFLSIYKHFKSNFTHSDRWQLSYTISIVQTLLIS